MQFVLKYFKHNWGFAIPFSAFILFCLIYILSFEKGALVLYFNSIQTPQLNTLFILVTKLAEWSVILLILLFLIWRNYGNAFIFFVAFTLNSILVQVLKKLVFNFPRPALYFKEVLELNFIENVAVNFHHSFPSGHTAAAFCIFSILALFSKNKLLQFFVCILAISVAISRVYLLQHFIVDVMAGAILGVFVAYVTYYFVNKVSFFNFQKWRHQSLSLYLSK